MWSVDLSQVLNILHAKSEDAGVYECQVSTEPPQSHKVSVSVEGKEIYKLKAVVLNHYLP